MSSEHASAPVALSVVIPTFNNETILRRAIESWHTFAETSSIEVIVVEDGCRDGTRSVLDEVSDTAWGRKHFRWIHMEDAHELTGWHGEIAFPGHGAKPLLTDGIALGGDLFDLGPHLLLG